MNSLEKGKWRIEDQVGNTCSTSVSHPASYTLHLLSTAATGNFNADARTDQPSALSQEITLPDVFNANIDGHSFIRSFFGERYLLTIHAIADVLRFLYKNHVPSGNKYLDDMNM